ncbi:DUF1097 family protein [Desulfotruncus alcoholivorax]|uniref:DUF1097 family protein n=1 Tax=Desulfotruncus alcoholivorax TaxID=265477 RepID=UPI000427F1D2|nr:DUF1097 family protein [Desulfotruncus alcoholivorax]
MEQKIPIFAKSRVIFGVLLIALIMIGEIVLHITNLPTWPAFVCMILYFYAHMDPKQIPHIIIGSLFGLVNYITLVMFVKAMAPTIGLFPAQLIYIGLFVGLIVLLKDHVSVVFNNNAFLLLFVAGVASKVPPAPQPMQWIAVQLIGGTALVLGVLGVQKIVAAITTPLNVNNVNSVSNH